MMEIGVYSYIILAMYAIYVIVLFTLAVASPVVRFYLNMESTTHIFFNIIWLLVYTTLIVVAASCSITGSCNLFVQILTAIVAANVVLQLTTLLYVYHNYNLNDDRPKIDVLQESINKNQGIQDKLMDAIKKEYSSNLAKVTSEMDAIKKEYNSNLTKGKSEMDLLQKQYESCTNRPRVFQTNGKYFGLEYNPVPSEHMPGILEALKELNVMTQQIGCSTRNEFIAAKDEFLQDIAEKIAEGDMPSCSAMARMANPMCSNPKMNCTYPFSEQYHKQVEDLNKKFWDRMFRAVCDNDSDQVDIKKLDVFLTDLYDSMCR